MACTGRWALWHSSHQTAGALMYLFWLYSQCLCFVKRSAGASEMRSETIEAALLYGLPCERALAAPCFCCPACGCGASITLSVLFYNRGVCLNFAGSTVSLRTGV